jgi:hypothetical protein
MSRQEIADLIHKLRDIVHSLRRAIPLTTGAAVVTRRDAP